MRAALATLFALFLCGAPLAGQERQPRTRPALPDPGVGLFSFQATLAEPCIENQPCFRDEGMSEGRRQALFTGGWAGSSPTPSVAVPGVRRVRPKKRRRKGPAPRVAHPSYWAVPSSVPWPGMSPSC